MGAAHAEDAVGPDRRPNRVEGTTLLRSLSLALAAMVLSLLFAEMAFRFYAIGWNALSYTSTRSIVRLGQSDLVQPASHPSISFELKPDQEKLFKMAMVRANSQGLHDMEYSLRKPENAYRVAVLGDSQTMASGVDREEAYHAVLESRLNPSRITGPIASRTARVTDNNNARRISRFSPPRCCHVP